MSVPKEPHFFSPDITTSHYGVRSRTEYLSLFRNATTQRIIGEASTLYLYSEEAAEGISHFDPDARIIISLRNPVDMMYSRFLYNRFRNFEDRTSFLEAISIEPDRRRGRNIPRRLGGYPVENLFYRGLATFSTQVQRYIDRFPSHQLLILIYDEFVSNVQSTYDTVLSFLEVDADIPLPKKAENIRRRPRLSFLDALAKGPTTTRMVRRILPADLFERAKHLWLRVNTSSTPPPPLGSEIRRPLEAGLAPEIDRLSEVIGRDLSFWLHH